jgi:hypothetical protein
MRLITCKFKASRSSRQKFAPLSKDTPVMAIRDFQWRSRIACECRSCTRGREMAMFFTCFIYIGVVSVVS